MRQTSSSTTFVPRLLPWIGLPIAGAAIWLLTAQPRVGELFARGLSTLLLTRAEVVLGSLLGLTVGLSLWLRQSSVARRLALEGANTCLQQLNDQLKEKIEYILQSERRSQLLFQSNPGPMLILDFQTAAI